MVLGRMNKTVNRGNRRRVEPRGAWMLLAILFCFQGFFLCANVLLLSFQMVTITQESSPFPFLFVVWPQTKEDIDKKSSIYGSTE
jgi:hypothetical protein